MRNGSGIHLTVSVFLSSHSAGNSANKTEEKVGEGKFSMNSLDEVAGMIRQTLSDFVFRRVVPNGERSQQLLSWGNRSEQVLFASQLLGKLQLIKEIDREVKDLDRRNDPESNTMLHDKKQSMTKQLN